MRMKSTRNRATLWDDAPQRKSLKSGMKSKRKNWWDRTAKTVYLSIYINSCLALGKEKNGKFMNIWRELHRLLLPSSQRSFSIHRTPHSHCITLICCETTMADGQANEFTEKRYTLLAFRLHPFCFWFIHSLYLVHTTTARFSHTLTLFSWVKHGHMIWLTMWGSLLA